MMMVSVNNDGKKKKKTHAEKHKKLEISSFDKGMKVVHLSTKK